MNFTIFKLYDPIKMINNETDAMLTGSMLGLAAILLFAGSLIVYKRRNLPL
ncbi:hypothetical protein ACFW35_12330 [Fictibacillus sp. NPDC058756]|uniref:hypothetical protein n=1 Tax=Fictibacillus sp. NPDC058756 TaxID=3346625 RepID=UPI00368618E6